MKKKHSQLSQSKAERLLCAVASETEPTAEVEALARRVAARLERALKPVGVGGDGVRAARDIELAEAARTGRVASREVRRGSGARDQLTTELADVVGVSGKKAIKTTGNGS